MNIRFFYMIGFIMKYYVRTPATVCVLTLYSACYTFPQPFYFYFWVSLLCCVVLCCTVFTRTLYLVSSPSSLRRVCNKTTPIHRQETADINITLCQTSPAPYTTPELAPPEA